MLIIVDPVITVVLPSGASTGALILGVPEAGGVGPTFTLSPAVEPSYFDNGQPSGVAMAPDNSILVAQKGGFTSGLGGVISVDPSNGAQTVVSSELAFVHPTGIAIDSSSNNGDGDVVVADSGANAVIRLDRQPNVQTVIASGSPFVSPSGVAVAQDGTIFVADPGLKGVALIAVGNSTPAVMHSGSPFVSPAGVSLSEDQSSVYVVDTGAKAVFNINRSTGTVTTVIQGGTLVKPTAIATAADGTLMVVDDAQEPTVYQLNPSTKALTTVVIGGTNMFSPTGIAIVSSDGNPPPPPTPIFQATQASRTGSSFPPVCTSSTFTVPPNVTGIQFELVGEHGYAAGSGGSGGFAQMVSGDLAVTPGEKLYINLGDNGSRGHNGGGYGLASGGAGGGDMSFISTNAADIVADGDYCSWESSYQSYLAIAGGGGGGGGDGAPGNGATHEGGTGGDAEANGHPGNARSPGDPDGPGGEAGQPGGTATGYPHDGSYPLGGHGGDAGTFQGAGGGGGGGGAGGGGGGGEGEEAFNAGGGGGGGASYLSPEVSNPSAVGYARTRDELPSITITLVKPVGEQENCKHMNHGKAKGRSSEDPQPGRGCDHR
jgi:sugar lactone lactonase YvrE